MKKIVITAKAELIKTPHPDLLTTQEERLLGCYCWRKPFGEHKEQIVTGEHWLSKKSLTFIVTSIGGRITGIHDISDSALEQRIKDIYKHLEPWGA